MNKQQREGAAAAAAWNEKYPVGTPVRVRRDVQPDLETKTRSEAWTLGHGDPVVKVEGITGGYSLDRVTPIAPPLPLD